MAEWKILREWSDKELQQRLSRLPDLNRNFSEPFEQMIPERGWHRYSSESIIARSQPGPPDALFECARQAVDAFEFSDPGIVKAFFDAEIPLRRRRLLLRISAFGIFHYLVATAVGEVRDEHYGNRSVYGFRYDTLEGHIERGAEWFLVSKDYHSGEISFRIEAAWQPGEFPNRWSRLGFHWIAPYYQKRWHTQAHRRMSLLLHRFKTGAAEYPDGEPDSPEPTVIFEKNRA